MKKRKSGIVTTKRLPRWKLKFNAAVKWLRRETWNALAGVGLVTLVVLLVQWIGG